MEKEEKPKLKWIEDLKNYPQYYGHWICPNCLAHTEIQTSMCKNCGIKLEVKKWD